MTSSWVLGRNNNLDGIKWGPMVAISVIFHGAVFLAALFVPESFSSSRSIDGIVYEVNLVEMPGSGKETNKNKSTGGAVNKSKKGKSVPKKQAKRIISHDQKRKPVVIAKRTLKKKSSKKKRAKATPSQLIDRAISRLERKVRTGGDNYVDRAISRLKKQVAGPGGTGTGSSGGGSLGGKLMLIYQMETENWVKSNWSYPAMDRSKQLEAVAVLLVKEDGSIVKTRFEKLSPNSLFNKSVSRAIERSNPLPPFPEGYRKSHDEFVITFNLEDLEN